jgi:hypothetical protein
MNERKSHVSAGVSMPASSDAIDALKALNEDGGHNLVQLVSFIATIQRSTPLIGSRKSTLRLKRWNWRRNRKLLSPNLVAQSLRMSPGTLSTVTLTITMARVLLLYYSYIPAPVDPRSRNVCYTQHHLALPKNSHKQKPDSRLTKGSKLDHPKISLLRVLMKICIRKRKLRKRLKDLKDLEEDRCIMDNCIAMIGWKIREFSAAWENVWKIKTLVEVWMNGRYAAVCIYTKVPFAFPK